MTDLQTIIADAYAEAEPQPALFSWRDTFRSMAELIGVCVIVAGLALVAMAFTPLPAPRI